MKLIGIIPARMAATRFPGKPLVNIIDRPMIAHVHGRANLYNWDYLGIATCDDVIEKFANDNNIKCIRTSDKHTRALDRITEAVEKINEFEVNDNDIVINVQGDEPMIQPDMFDALISPILRHDYINATILSINIVEESIWRNPDTLKIIHNANGEVLYTSRAALPYNKNTFSGELEAKRIYGLFAFRWKYLKQFSNHNQTYLEQTEACDSNRILDMNFRQYIAPYPYVKSYSVDSPSDVLLVESHIINDKYWGKY